MQRLISGSIISIALLGAVACSTEVDGSRPKAGGAVPGGTTPGVGTGPGMVPPGGTTPVGTGPGVVPPPPPTGAVFGPTALRPITNTQYRNSLAHLLTTAAPADALEQEPLSPTTRNLDNNSTALTVTSILASQYAGIADKLVKAYPAAACAGASEAACGDEFIQSFGKRAYRRPLSATEFQRYQALFASELARTQYQGAITQVIETMLQSPNFLYRFELGDASQGANRSLSAYEVATELAYLITGSTPDDTLLAAADSGAVLTLAQREQQARRLLTLEGAKPTLRYFLEMFVGTSRLEELQKTTTVYPAYTPELRDAMKLETQQYIDSVLEGDNTFSTLLTGNYSFVNSGLAAHYGLPDPGGAALVRTTVNPNERMGILTQPGVLAAHSKAFESFPIARGKFVRVGLLCQALQPPPKDLAVEPVKDDPTLTTRERFTAHSANPACSGCHALIDPIGYGLENYDGIGQYRTMENNKPVDAKGSILGSIDADGPFEGGPQLATKLAASLETKQCLTLQAYRWAFGRDESVTERDVVNAIAQEHAVGGLDMREVLVSLAKSDNFVFRTFR